MVRISRTGDGLKNNPLPSRGKEILIEFLFEAELSFGLKTIFLKYIFDDYKNYKTK